MFEHGELTPRTYRRARAKSKVMIWPGADFMAMRKGDPDNPDLLYCDPGSVNLVSYDPVTKRTRNEGSVYRVPFDAARRQLEKIQELGMRATVQMFDPSYARATLLFLEQGLLTEPLMIKFYFGGPELPFGLPLNVKSLEAYLEMFKGVRLNWFAATLGGDNLPNIPADRELGRARAHRLGGPSLRRPGQAHQSADSRARFGHDPRDGPSGCYTRRSARDPEKYSARAPPSSDARRSKRVTSSR